MVLCECECECECGDARWRGLPCVHGRVALGLARGRWPAAVLMCHRVSDVCVCVSPPVGVCQSLRTNIEMCALHIRAASGGSFRPEACCEELHAP